MASLNSIVSSIEEDPVHYVPLDQSDRADLKKVYLVRHGQAYHNIGDCNKNPDAPLTPHGKMQALKINCSISVEVVPDLILFSPLRRAVETLIESYGHHCLPGENLIPCLAIADLQEDWNGEPSFDCDTGSDPAVLQTAFPTLDFSSLPDNWMRADSHLPRRQKLEERHARVRSFISSRPEEVIMIFAHHGTIKGLLGLKEGIKNGDTLEYKFDVKQSQFLTDVPFTHHKNDLTCTSPDSLYSLTLSV